MIRKLLVPAILAVIGGLGAVWAVTAPDPIPQADIPGEAGDLERGRYIYALAGCSSCHIAPGSKDKSVLAGGQAFATEFGTFIAPNISSSAEYGIGGWSNADFANAVLRGVSPSGRHYYPAFPYTSYQRMTMADVIDLKAYMDTLPAVDAAAPSHEVSFPFNLRRGLGVWKWLYVDGKAFQSDPALSDVENRGAYIVNGPGHCNECHTPRSAIGGLNFDRRLAGAPNPDGEGRIPNITPHEDGLGSWSAKDIAYGLESGFTPEFDVMGGSMGKVIDNTALLTAEDRDAIAAYLATVPALPDTR